MNTEPTIDPRTAGFALPAAVLALLVVGVLVTGGFFAAQQEQRISIAGQNAQEALYLAERGIGDALENWDASTYGALTKFSSTPAVYADTLAEGHYRVEITKVSDWTYYLESEGTVTRGNSSGARQVGLIAKLRTASIDPPAALTTVGSLRLGGASEVYGQDSIPSAWKTGGICDTSTMENKPGVMIDDTDNISTSGSRYVVSGTPPADEDPTITSDNLLQFGEVSWQDLVALADIRIPNNTTVTGTAADSVLSGGKWVCRTSNNRNWGAPLKPGSVCGNHFPIIYGEGILKINSNGYGQGILLVEDDLNLQGGFTFYGPVIVKGTLSTAGTGGHFNGGVIAANVDLETTTVLGNALVQYSSCAVTRAILNSASLTRVEALAARSWVDLSNLSGG